MNLGKFPYKSSWIEKDSEGRPQKQFDGNIAVRYMEYPVLTGVYQYVSMALAKTYSALTKLVPVPVIAEVVMFFNISAFGLALAWFATVWATANLAGRRDLGCGAGGGITDSDLSDLHQLRRAGNGFRGGRHAGLGAAKTGGGRRADRAGGGGQAVSALAADPVGDPRCAHRAASGRG